MPSKKGIVLPTIFPVACHTDNVGPDSTFVAIKGQKQDGVAYIPEALQRGAKLIVAQFGADIAQDTLKMIQDLGAHLRLVPNTRKTLASLSAKAHGNPARELEIIGITGTKGKTSTAFILEHILRHAGHKTALLSTVHNKIDDTIFHSSLTTAHPDYLHSFFSVCVQQGVKYVVMEVAAQALSLHRVDGIYFDGAILTNFSREHGEFYDTQDDYFAAKCQLFDQLTCGAPVLINADDENGRLLLGKHPGFYSFGIKRPREVFCWARPIELINGLACCVSTGNDCTMATCPALFGKFNAYNMLGVLALTRSLGVSFAQGADAMQTFKGIPGRLERYELPNGAVALIDHAHNPSSFQALLSALRPMTDNLIVVFGAGGDRDKEKRPEMGEIVTWYADRIILTSDNPRSEDVADIIDQIFAGIPEKDREKVICEPDREQAIKKAYELSTKKSLIALLGKGRDEYQIFGSEKIYFSEREILGNLSCL